MGHTQGPWKHEVRIRRGTYGQPVKGSPYHHFISGPRPAANSVEPVICHLGPMSGQTEANAKLIAAAPDLLEAAEYFLTTTRWLTENVGTVKDARTILIKAINKARGV